ncbi:FAD-dependent oxidoreductase [Akkermansiaceae bacterium]|nr:FAD-dependent oxidoreductase [Akkermansiaceae bacterium]
MGAENVVVVGGGVIGLASAYYLAKSGRKVTVLERDPSLLSGCSAGNAGMVVPSHFIPLAAPGVIGQGLRWMLDPKSPFFLRPRIDLDLARWVWTFFRHANARHVAESEELLRDLSLESRRLHQELSKAEGFDLTERGLLMLCQGEKGLEDESEVIAAAHRLGLEAEIFGKEKLREFEPETEVNAIGGVWWKQDCHLSPVDFANALIRGILRDGGTFVEGEAVDFIREGKDVTGVKTAAGEEITGGRIVLAGGIATIKLARRLGLRMPMQGGKGYSFTLPKPRKSLRLCSLLKEGRVAVTPMGEKLLVAGTMEICGSDTSISRLRLEGIIDHFCRFYPDFRKEDFDGIEPWVGLRPCSPDGLPYLGYIPGQPRVIAATGHAMMGLSLAPSTGWLVEKLVSGEPGPIPLTQLDPARFG